MKLTPVRVHTLRIIRSRIFLPCETTISMGYNQYASMMAILSDLQMQTEKISLYKINEKSHGEVKAMRSSLKKIC